MAGIQLNRASRALLESDAVAHVVTLDEDGGPHVTAAWVGLDDDEIIFATLPDQRKLRNLRRDSRYIGPDVAFPGMPDPPPGYVTRITAERLGGVGPWNPGRR